MSPCRNGWVKLQGFAADKNPDDLLWPDLTHYKLWKQFGTRMKACKLWREGMSIHTLRRCYATYTQGQGLQEALGHTSDTMTARYIRPIHPCAWRRSSLSEKQFF